MIFEKILDILFIIPYEFLEFIPDIEFDFIFEAGETITSIFQCIFYILPMPPIFGILTFMIIVLVYKIVIALLRTISAIIPFF